MGWVAALVGGLAAAGSTAYAASQAPGAASPISYAKEYRNTLRTQLKFAPNLYSARQQYDPLYQALDQELLMNRLFGFKGGEQEIVTSVPTEVKGHYAQGSFDPHTRQYTRGEWVPAHTEYEDQRSKQNVPPTRGLVDLVENDLAPAARRVQSADERARIENEIGVLNAYGPSALAALKQANPEQSGILDELNKQAQDELGQGAHLDPSLRREVEQSVRAGQAARGLGYSPTDNYTEAMEIGSAGQALRDRRRAFAGSVVGLDSATYGDPYQRFFGRSSGATGGGQNFLSDAYATPGRTSNFNPESPLAASATNANFNAAQAAYIGGQNSLNSAIGGGVGLAGQLGAAYMQYNRPRSPIGYNNVAGGTGLY